MKKKLVSIIIPLLNEEEIIDLFCHELFNSIGKLKTYDFQINFIDNFSSDNTVEKIKSKKNNDVNILELTNYYGKENAILCGLDHSSGDYIIIMDPDLQDPPEKIASLISNIEKGYDVVYAKRTNTDEKSFLLKTLKSIYYKVFSIFSDKNLEIFPNTGDFKIINSKVKSELCNMREYTRFNRSLTSYVSYKSTYIEYVRPDRPFGKSKSNYKFLINYGVNSIVSSSSKPLEIWFYFGIGWFIISILLSIFIIFQKITSSSLEGWASTLLIFLLFSSFNTLTLGIICLYLNRIYLEVKKRPNYILKK